MKLPLLTYLVFVLQGTLAPGLAVEGFTPQLVLLALVPTVLHVGGRRGLLCAAAWGLLSDCLTGTCLGADMITFSLTAYTLQAVRRRSLLTSPVSMTLLGTALIFANLAGATALRCWQAGQVMDHSLFRHAAIAAVYSGAILFGWLVLRQFAGSLLPAARTAPTATVANRWRMLTE